MATKKTILVEQTNSVLRTGEVTGHHHIAVGRQAPVTVFANPETQEKFCEVPEGGLDVKHDEHLTIPLDGIAEKGDVLAVVPQQQFNYLTNVIRRVED